jgi:hypothetical protein
MGRHLPTSHLRSDKGQIPCLARSPASRFTIANPYPPPPKPKPQPKPHDKPNPPSGAPKKKTQKKPSKATLEQLNYLKSGAEAVIQVGF